MFLFVPFIHLLQFQNAFHAAMHIEEYNLVACKLYTIPPFSTCIFFSHCDVDHHSVHLKNKSEKNVEKKKLKKYITKQSALLSASARVFIFLNFRKCAGAHLFVQRTVDNLILAIIYASSPSSTPYKCTSGISSIYYKYICSQGGRV